MFPNHRVGQGSDDVYAARLQLCASGLMSCMYPWSHASHGGCFTFGARQTLGSSLMLVIFLEDWRGRSCVSSLQTHRLELVPASPCRVAKASQSLASATCPGVERAAAELHSTSGCRTDWYGRSVGSRNHISSFDLFSRRRSETSTGLGRA
jgi:hypothetical protein